MSSKTFSSRAIDYCKDVLSGKIPASKAIQAACRRHLDDLGRQNTQGFNYVYDAPKAELMCKFVERCTHTDTDDLTGEFIHLEDWQVWILCCIYGWVYASGKKQGKRKYQKAYIFVGKGNGKTSLSSSLALAHLTIDAPKGGASVLCCAVTQKQASLLFEKSRIMAMADKSRSFMKKLGINFVDGFQVGARAITTKKHSKFSALSGEAKSLDGLIPSVVFLDEIGGYPDRDLYDVLQSTMAKRISTLMIMITTAGHDLEGIGKEQYDYGKKVLAGLIKDESYFAALYELDKGDDWQGGPDIWRKANPNWDVSVFTEPFEIMVNEAVQVHSKQPNFFIKNLNMWVSDSSRFFDVPSWQSSYDPNLKIDDFKGQQCWVGLDCASTSDLTALSFVFRKGEHVYIFPKFYLPESAVKASPVSSYRGWAIEKKLTVTEGNVTDYDVVKRDIIEASKKFNVHSINFDPWNAAHLITQLQQQINGNKFFEVGQTASKMSGPTKELDRLSRSGRLHHNSEILTWCAFNTFCRYDENGNVKPNKETKHSANKIDGIISSAVALATMMETPVKVTRDWSKAVSW